MPDITLMGATYPGVPAVELPTSGGGTATYTDVTDTTAVATDVAQGKTFYLANGTKATGTSSGGGTTSHTTIAVILTVAGWSNNAQTVSASPVTTTNDVIVSPDPSSAVDWAAAGILCTAQGAGTLTFTCATTPTDALTANVMVLSGGVSSASGEVF